MLGKRAPTKPALFDGDQPASSPQASTDSVKPRVVRRVVGGAAIVAGALLMWFSPRPLEGADFFAGGALLVAGVALELIGITLERR